MECVKIGIESLEIKKKGKNADVVKMVQRTGSDTQQASLFKELH